MKLSPISVLVRTSALLVVVGCAPAPSGDPTGRGGAAGVASCSAGGTGGSSSFATWSGVKTVIGFYCGGAGCHNEGQPPNYFPGDDATLYRTLMEYKVDEVWRARLDQALRSGGERLLPRPDRSDRSDVRSASEDALRLRSRELYVARGSRGRSPVDRQGRPYGLRRFAGCRAATRAAIRGCFARHASTSFAAQRG